MTETRSSNRSSNGSSSIVERADDVPVPLIVIDATGRVADFNIAADAVFGGNHGLLRMGAPFMPLDAPSVRSFVQWRDDLEAGPLRVRLRTGTEKITAELTKTYLEREPTSMVLAVKVHDHSGATDAHRLAFDESATGMFVSDATGRVLAVNEAMLQIAGLGRDVAIGEDWQRLFLSKTSTAFAREVHRDLRAGFEWSGRVVVDTDDTEMNQVLDVTLRYRPLAASATDETVSRLSSDLTLVGFVVDETEDDAAQRALRDEARRDALTGLLNRAGFLEVLGRQFDDAQRSGEQLTLLYLDLDNFKTLNDNFGHRYGDVLLEAFAKRLRSALKSSDTVGRVGGDEFVVLFDPGLEPHNLETVVQKLRARLLEDYQLDDLSYTCTASFGSAEYPWDAGSAEQLLEFADHAMYQAKSSGRNSHSRFDRAQYDGKEDRASLLQAIESGLDETEFVPYYQPIYDVNTGEIRGAEALVRWVDRRNGGSVRLPRDFMPSIDGNTTSVRLGVLILEQVVDELQRFASDLPVPIAVNLDAAHLRSDDIANIVEEVVDRRPSLAERFRVEISESAFYDEDPIVTKNLARIGATGVGLTLDDFGIGVSSLLSVTAHEFSQLKIHSRVLDGVIAGRVAELALFSTIIQMGQALGLQTVAVGVETDEQLAVVQSHGCDLVQGFLLGHPMPAEQFRQLLTSRAAS